MSNCHPEIPADARIDGLVPWALSRGIPLQVTWELTHRCNLACPMCYNVPSGRPELSTAECLAILDDLARWGVLFLVFTGGEILARPDFFVLAERARANRFALGLKTNATLITPDRARRIAALAPVRVDVSLHGATDATVATMTGREDVLARIVRGVRLLRKEGVRVRLQALITRHNHAELEALQALAEELDAPLALSYKLSPADDGTPPPADWELTDEALIPLLARETVAAVEPLPERTCQVGRLGCVIAPDGVVYPCLELRIPAGDLRRRSFGEIWYTSPLLQRLRDHHVRARLPDCRICPLQAYCTGRCAGTAHKEWGDPFLGHASACRQAQMRYRHHHPEHPVPDTPVLRRLREQPAPARVRTPILLEN